MFTICEIEEDSNSINTHSKELQEINIKKYLNMLTSTIKPITTINKKKINIIFCDLEDHNDECLINAANELLEGGGGIDGYVHNLGGEKLMNEIYSIPLNKYKCRLLEGESIFTNGYNNKYTKFIHTVAPYYDDFDNMKYDIMKKCFDTIFHIINNKDIKSITIPPIGTGFYGFHMYDFTIICFEKILEHLELNSKIEKITLLTNSKLQFNYYKYYFDNVINL